MTIGRRHGQVIQATSVPRCLCDRSVALAELPHCEATKLSLLAVTGDKPVALVNLNCAATKLSPGIQSRQKCCSG
jgi:hypothetical protein